MLFIIFIIVLLSFIFFIKFFLIPLFVTPSFRLLEVTRFLEKKDYFFIEKRNTKTVKKEKPFFLSKDFIDKIQFVQSYFIVIAFDNKNKKYLMFWLEIQSSLTLFGKRKLSFILEKDEKLNLKLQKEFTETPAPASL